MKGIGGNVNAIIETSEDVKNAIGETVKTWTEKQTITGWLDLSAGDSRYTTYHAKIQESTHMFIADYVELDSTITAENSRLTVNGAQYDILLIDNPMEMRGGSQLEIYLRFTGGQ